MTKYNPQEQRQALERAEAIVSLTQCDGWPAFVEMVEEAARVTVPSCHGFTAEEATRIASRVTFASGLRHVLALVEQQKETLRTKKA